MKRDKHIRVELRDENLHMLLQSLIMINRDRFLWDYGFVTITIERDDEGYFNVVVEGGDEC